MRVVICLAHFDTWSGYQELNTARALAKLGHEVTVITSNIVEGIFPEAALREAGRERVYPTGESEWHGVRILRFPCRLWIRNVVLCRGSLAYVWRADFEVLLALNPGQLFGILHSVAAALKRKGRRIIVFQDCSAQYAALPAWLRTLKRGAFYLLKGPLYALGMAVSSAVFANTPEGVQLIRRIPFGGCCRYLPLAYDEDVYYFSEAEREQVRNEMGWSAEIVVITTGRAIPEKKLERLIDAFEVLASSGAAVRLILSGVMADDYGNAIRRKAQLSPARNRISVFGFISRERTRQLLNAADIGVWPRQPAISIQQAMGTGLFCVLPKNLYVGHLLTDKTGSYFESDNWSEMTTVLATAIRNASMFETHCRVRRAEINRRFCSAAVAQTLVESFCSVLPFGLQPRPAGTGGAQTYE